jgi:glutamine synthetase
MIASNDPFLYILGFVEFGLITMNDKEIIDCIRNGNHNRIKYAVTDIDGVLRGKAVSSEKFLKQLHQDIGFCNVIFGWDVMDDIYDHESVAGWHTGFPDSTATIDLNTFRQLPWDDHTPFLLADFHKSTSVGKVCPRSLLKKVQKEAEELGFKPIFSSEYEWVNFSETAKSLKEKEFSKPEPLTPGMFGYSMLRISQYSDFFNHLYDNLIEAGIPILAMHTETGDGAYEASIHHSEVLEAADRSVLFKLFVKEIASRFEITASFMAKWSDNLPGSGAHIHQSLWNSEKEINLFHSENSSDMSELMQQYLAGQLYCLPDILPMYAPTVNSYKRFVEGSWASTSVSWGIDNRTTALRVIQSDHDNSRIENRVPGADTNPYLAMAASLASGLYGIKNRLTLDMPATSGNEYGRKDGNKLSGDLNQATEKMKNSVLAKELFGEHFTDHFVKSREWEWNRCPDQSSKGVTPWEIKRYFEII